MFEVTCHKPVGLPNDLNSCIKIVASVPAVGGAPASYDISGGSGGVVVYLVTIPFQQGALKDVGLVNGVTIEALLAVAKHQLECHQKGALPCRANETAIAAINTAMAVLHNRSREREAQKVEGRAMPHKEASSSRITLTDKVLTVCPNGGVKRTEFSADELRTSWQAWPNKLLPVLKELPPPLTAAEWDVLSLLAQEAPSRNGFIEIRSYFEKSKLV